MGIRSSVLAAVFTALAVPASAVPFTSSVEQNGGGDGSATISFPSPGSAVVQLSGSNEAPSFHDPAFGRFVETIIWLTYEGLTPFRLIADWAYTSLDAYPGGEIFGYYPDENYNNYIDLIDANGEPTSGQVTLDLETGSTFGFYILTVDNCCGRASATITFNNIPYVPSPSPDPSNDPSPTPSPVPLPASAALFLPALGALGLLRRRTKGVAVPA